MSWFQLAWSIVFVLGPLYFSSLVLAGLLRGRVRTRWSRRFTLSFFLLGWLLLFGAPFINPGILGLEILNVSTQMVKLWGKLFARSSFDVSLAWIQTYLWLIPAWTFWKIRLRKSAPETPKYLNAYGYVVLEDINELEHRYIARQILGRSLDANEVVHHINGDRADNRITNLCLMDSEKHEHFHAWLRWKREKSGRYPSIKDQKRILAEEYKGSLLESLKKGPKWYEKIRGS